MNKYSALLFPWLWIAFWQPSLASDNQAIFSPDSVQWTRVEMTASKFLVSMEAVLELETLDISSLESRLITPVLPGERQRILAPRSLAYSTDGLGRRNEGQLLLDARSGHAFQRATLKTGGSPKYRIYRLEEDRILRVTWRPGPEEAHLRPERWTRRSEESYGYPLSVTRPVVTEATALIYLAAAANLHRPGDRLDILTLASDEFYTASLIVREPAEARVDYFVTDGGQDARRTGRMTAIRVAIEARPVDGASHDEFELFGLTDLELLLDPQTRAPLEIRGSVEYFGGVTFTMDRMTLLADRAD